jgi:chromosome segregation ATPase
MTEIPESEAMAAREHADLRVNEIEGANAAVEQMRERLSGVEEELATTFSSLTHQATDMVNLEIGIQEAEATAVGLQEELSRVEAKSKATLSEAVKEAQVERRAALGESIALSRGFIQEQREHLKVSEARWAQAEELYGDVVKELMDLLERAPDQSESVYGVLGQLQDILEANRVIVEGNRSIVRGEEGRLTELMRKLM